MEIDLQSYIKEGGCSAKLSPKQLEGIVAKFPTILDKNLLVGIDTHDDAGVYKISETQAIIFTTDFFPPMCSDPFVFGKIAATNALSDVYAMGGNPLLVLNLVMFPVNKLDLDICNRIVAGGQKAITDANALLVGGHTIIDDIPKYGCAAVGIVDPRYLATNSGVEEGDILVLTKPLGTGVILAASRCDMVDDESLEQVLNSMATLNKEGAVVTEKFNVKGMTDITGFGLLGHAMRMAQASNVSIKIYGHKLPLFPNVREVMEEGCIPGGIYRNLDFISDHVDFSLDADFIHKYVACDAQTSGGLLIAVPRKNINELRLYLYQNYNVDAVIIGEAIPRLDKSIYFYK